MHVPIRPLCILLAAVSGSLGVNVCLGGSSSQGSERMVWYGIGKRKRIEESVVSERLISHADEMRMIIGVVRVCSYE